MVNMGLADVLGELVGHDVRLEQRRYGRTTHYWSMCSCGYESGHGKSSRFAIAAGAGHLKRIGARLRAEMDGQPPAPAKQGTGGRVSGSTSVSGEV